MTIYKRQPYRIAALCPTYGKPRLLANALAMFQAQTYDANTPGKMRRLFILDDAGQFGSPNSAGIFSTCGDDFDLWSYTEKFPTLTAKYAFLVQRALEWGADAFCVWDDDDIALPNHLADHAAVLQSHGWSHPRTVLSLYTGQLVEEGASGRFHPALAFRRDYGERVGFWGPVTNGRCDYDQGIMGRLRAISPPGQSSKPPTFVYRWGSTQADHCSGRCKGPDDTTWYTDTPISQPGHFDTLEPLMDEETKRVYRALA